MNEILIASLRATARDLYAISEITHRKAERSDTTATAIEKTVQDAAQNPGGGTLYKKPNGRMTEAGAAAIDASFAAGATVTQVAEQYGIHTSAASYRYARFLEAQGKKPKA